MASAELSVVEISRLDDGLLLPWLDLYETSFPPSEKVLVSVHLKTLKEKALGLSQDHHLLAAVQDDFIGIARYEMRRDLHAAYFWYLAIAPAMQGRGLGAILYSEVIRRMAVDDPACRAVVFEVEIPEEAADQKGRLLAERRIRFYRRLDARILGGISYLQSVGPHQPPIPMHLMVHSLRPTEPEEAFHLADTLFSGKVTQTGDLRLS